LKEAKLKEKERQIKPLRDNKIDDTKKEMKSEEKQKISWSDIMGKNSTTKL